MLTCTRCVQSVCARCTGTIYMHSTHALFICTYVVWSHPVNSGSNTFSATWQDFNIAGGVDLLQYRRGTLTAARNIAPIFLVQAYNIAILRALGISHRRCARRPWGRRKCTGDTLTLHCNKLATHSYLATTHMVAEIVNRRWTFTSSCNIGLGGGM